jgi:hypothetical protein
MPLVSERKRPGSSSNSDDRDSSKSKKSRTRSGRDGSTSEESANGNHINEGTQASKQPKSKQVKDPEAVDDPKEPFVALKKDVILSYLDLPPVTPVESPLPAVLTPSEQKELETVLEFDTEGEGWRTDWSGNLAYVDTQISNPKASSARNKSFKQSLVLWAQNVPGLTHLVYNLLRYVYHMEETPTSAKVILSAADPSSLFAIEAAMRRVSYDPKVLQEDGWTTTGSLTREGATGGPFWIGAKIRWQDSDAVVIAYVHDPDIGDLWKAYWIAEQHCFDLEAEEVYDAKKKWERRHNINSADAASRKSTRFSGSRDFSVEGIQYGIVLAASYSKGARPGVYWPARIMHASENTDFSIQTKRVSAKQKVDVVFLAPYWNTDNQPSLKGKNAVTSLSEAASWAFNSGPLFRMENIEATDQMIKEFTFGAEGQLDLDELQMSFRFTGLPKPAFSRFLDAHRLAMGLRAYAKQHLKSEISSTNSATAGLFETHVMSVQAPLFPTVVLHLPFEYILDQIRDSQDSAKAGPSSQNIEPMLVLDAVIQSMKPPNCWGMGTDYQVKDKVSLPKTPDANHDQRYNSEQFDESPEENGDSDDVEKLFESMAMDLSLLKNALGPLKDSIVQLLGPLVSAASVVAESEDSAAEPSSDEPKMREALIHSWATLKRIGIDVFSSHSDSKKGLLSEWAVAAERLYRYIVHKISVNSKRNGGTLVLSDYRCNGHRTEEGCFERPVRLPAAMKGAKLAGAGQSERVGLVTELGDDCIKRVERFILPKAHTRAYLDRMKRRCAAAKSNEESLVLTDDSNGNGGQDTRKYKICVLLV